MTGGPGQGRRGVRWEAFERMLREDRHDNPPAFLHRMSHLFGNADLTDRSVVEVGSGRGLLALYVALRGARRVLSIEPEFEGSSSGAISVQRRRVTELDLSNVEILAEDFNTWDSGGEQFDLLVSINSVNHLYESTQHALAHEETRQRYIAIAGRMRAVLRPGGAAIVQDSCRYGLFLQGRQLGLHRPWTSRRHTKNWRIHQNPRTWRRIFREAGFQRVEIDYPIPYQLRHLKGIANTAVGAFMMQASFIIRCYA